jgi:hypothetical protein
MREKSYGAVYGAGDVTRGRQSAPASLSLYTYFITPLAFYKTRLICSGCIMALAGVLIKNAFASAAVFKHMCLKRAYLLA